MKTAIITGITGQDGSYLAELLLSKGYKVIGIVRRISTEANTRIQNILDSIEIANADLTDEASLHNVMELYQPDEVYNLASQSFVPASWTQAVASAEVTALGVTRILEAIRSVNPKIKFFQASSSALFGETKGTLIDESTPFNPINPYGVAKLYAHYMVLDFARQYEMFATAGILFNHESPRRGEEFVTKKIAKGVVRIKKGLDKELKLGNLEAQKDWGFAGDYVKAVYAMLQQENPEIFVVGTGQAHSVREFCEIAFTYLNLDYKDFVKVDEKFVRPKEATTQICNPSKIKKELGWEAKVSFKQLVEMMVEDELSHS